MCREIPEICIYRELLKDGGIKFFRQQNGRRFLPGGGLNFASASNATPYGAAASSWKISDGVMEWTVVIPPNATGTIVFPTANPRSIRVDGNRPAESSLTIKDGYPAMLKVPSGEYRILLRPDIKTAAK